MSEFYMYGFVIESDRMAAGFVIKYTKRPTAKGYTKFICGVLRTNAYNVDTDGGIFAYGTFTILPEEDYVLKNSKGYEFRDFFITDIVDLRNNNFAQLKIKIQQFCNISYFS